MSFCPAALTEPSEGLIIIVCIIIIISIINIIIVIIIIGFFGFSEKAFAFFGFLKSDFCMAVLYRLFRAKSAQTEGLSAVL